MLKKVDLHVHTDNSFDGNHSATFFCEKAEFLDLRAVAFTDHCEVDQFRGNRQYEKRIFQAFFALPLSAHLPADNLCTEKLIAHHCSQI